MVCSMISLATKAGIEADYFLADAWFATKPLLKIFVRDRKNAMFKKTLAGALMTDVNTSMIATESEAGINVFEYFTHLQQHKD